MPETEIFPEIDTFLEQAFEQNYEELRVDSGRSIAPDVKKTALQHVLLYWRKLRAVAENVTDTEVRLSLPGQETPKGRDFTIEGVVDILRENDRTVMYDIKTHDAEYVRANIELYEAQLNVYAHIWRELRQQPLDGTAVIATDFPEEVRSALSSESEELLAYALANWEPVVEIAFDPHRVDETIRSFGTVVDCIEDGKFTPPLVERLREMMPGKRHVRFGTHICSNCDARFSCVPYRQFAQAARQIAERSEMHYFIDTLNDVDQEAWRTGNLDAALEAEDLLRDFSTR